MKYRYKPNRAQNDDYIEKMESLIAWLAGEGREYRAERAMTGTVYFEVLGVRYRIASHRAGINYDGETCFHASPLRAPEICAAIVAGEKLNKRGTVA
jgi:hypothetical protein